MTLRGGPGYVAASTPVSAVPGAFVAVVPARVLDTRLGLGAPKVPVAVNGSVAVQVAGVGGIPASGAGSVLINLTVPGPSGAGALVAYADGAAKPGTSNLQYTAGRSMGDVAVVPIGVDGKIRIANLGGVAINLIGDL